MEKISRSEADDPREHTLRIDVLRSMLSHEQIYNIAVDVEFARLRQEDPLTDEIIRYFVERYYPGHKDMAQKEKAARIMLAAFRIRSRVDETLDGLNLREILREIDNLTTPPAD